MVRRCPICQKKYYGNSDSAIRRHCVVEHGVKYRAGRSPERLSGKGLEHHLAKVRRNQASTRSRKQPMRPSNVLNVATTPLSSPQTTASVSEPETVSVVNCLTWQPLSGRSPSSPLHRTYLDTLSDISPVRHTHDDEEEGLSLPTGVTLELIRQVAIHDIDLSMDQAMTKLLSGRSSSVSLPEWEVCRIALITARSYQRAMVQPERPPTPTASLPPSELNGQLLPIVSSVDLWDTDMEDALQNVTPGTPVEDERPWFLADEIFGDCQ